MAKQGGPAELAKSLGIARPTVYMWWISRSTPSAENLKLLKDYSKGELSYEDIIEGTARQ